MNWWYCSHSSERDQVMKASREMHKERVWFCSPFTFLQSEMIHQFVSNHITTCVRVCVFKRVALHCAGSQSPHVSAAGPEPIASSLRSPAGSSTVLNPDPEAMWPPEKQRQRKKNTDLVISCRGKRRSCWFLAVKVPFIFSTEVLAEVGTLAWTWNSSCTFPTVACQNVCCEKKTCWETCCCLRGSLSVSASLSAAVQQSHHQGALRLYVRMEFKHDITSSRFSFTVGLHSCFLIYLHQDYFSFLYPLHIFFDKLLATQIYLYITVKSAKNGCPQAEA